MALHSPSGRWHSLHFSRASFTWGGTDASMSRCLHQHDHLCHNHRSAVWKAICSLRPEAMSNFLHLLLCFGHGPSVLGAHMLFKN